MQLRTLHALLLCFTVLIPLRWARALDGAATGDRRPGHAGFDLDYGDSDEEEDEAENADKDNTLTQREKQLREEKRQIEQRVDNDLEYKPKGNDFFNQIVENHPKQSDGE